jgi:glycosyltransferase involved in cell wall biosynthesis
VNRSVLIVAQLAPPSNLVAARRVAGMAKYLGRIGYRSTVVSSRISGQGEIEGAEEVVRTRDALLSPLNWRKRHFDALGGGSEDVYKPPSRLAYVVVPDLALVSWVPFALPRVLSLAHDRQFDCVVTTSPPQSAHLIGLTLRRRGFGWIAEFRDGWTFEPPRRAWPLAAQRDLDTRLERAVVTRADAVVGVTKPIVDDLRARLGADAHVITNGFDPDEVELPSLESDPLLAPDRHSLVHTGRMGLARVTPRPILEALRLLERDAPELAGRLEVVFAGPLTQDEKELFSAFELNGLVRVTGSLERGRALRLQRAADSLLVITEGSRRRSVATGKLFEYLAAGRPVLVLGEETEAARIVREAHAGFATSASNPRAIAEALRRMVEGEHSSGGSDSVNRFSWPVLAVEYSSLIEDVARSHTP